MKVTFGTICLNEAEFLGANLRQHYDFCDEWILVEGADRRFPGTMASEDGLSIDATADIVRNFPDPDKKLRFVQHGWAADKSELRNRYAEHTGDGLLIVFDADEFLTHADLERLIEKLKRAPSPSSLRIPHIHFWKSQRQIITGGYYDVPHDRAYRTLGGCRYRENHNHPCMTNAGGLRLNDINHLCDERKLKTVPSGVMHDGPAWLHFGFVKEPQNIQAKNDYYVARGERVTRPETTRDRAAWFEDVLPPGLELHRWLGPIPEVFIGFDALKEFP